MKIKILLLLVIILSSCGDELEVFHVDKVDDTGQVHVELFNSGGWWLTNGSKVNNYIRDLYNNTKHDETVVLVGRLTNESLAYDTIVKLKDVHRIEESLNKSIVKYNEHNNSNDSKDDPVISDDTIRNLRIVVLSLIAILVLISLIAFIIVLYHKYKIIKYIRDSKSTDLDTLKRRLIVECYDPNIVNEVINEINKELKVDHEKRGYND